MIIRKCLIFNVAGNSRKMPGKFVNYQFTASKMHFRSYTKTLFISRTLFFSELLIGPEFYEKSNLKVENNKSEILLHENIVNSLYIIV